ncbi:MAG: exodeoxyribonuclease III [Rickettsiales bacterium]|nr:exodeoxyribonuclease III [Rickettsiales bacterium]OUV79808.1 MAG: exodeoxyribonuclease III [Rickettsiales bacterium TMED131]
MTKLTIASWNVNSIRARLPLIIKWLRNKNPDLLLLQELKANEENIPREEIEELNYNFITMGQKAYNGVAILSKFPVSDIECNLPNFKNDDQARYIEAWVNLENKGIRIASIYAPNGNPINSEKFTYKLSWLEKFKEHAAKLFELEEFTILGGDFNICPTSLDTADETLLYEDAIYKNEVKNIYKNLLNKGYYDAYRTLYPDKPGFTYWDYGQSFTNDIGVRIDHFLLSPYAMDITNKVYVDKEPRKWIKPSDHTPICLEIDI